MVLRWIDKHLKWIFTLPTVVFVLAMIVFPIGYTFVISFFEWSMSNSVPMKFVGLDNYINMFTDNRFLDAMLRTFAFSGISLVIQIFGGIAIALFLHRSFVGKGFVKTAFLLPMVATPVAVGLVWTLIYEPSIGIANKLLTDLGFAPSAWLGGPDTALPSLMIVDIWQWTPMVMLIVLAGLSALPTDVFESAKVDGAGRFRTLWHITLPLLRPTIFTAALLRVIDILKTFDIIYATTQGGPGYATETMNILSFRYAFEYFQFGRASATLVVFFIIVMVIAAIFIKIKNKVEVDV